MGYTTKFDGTFKLSRELKLSEFQKLKDIADRDHRDEGGEPNAPGYYCQWTPTKDGKGIRWDGNEKFYDYQEWLQHLIDNYLKPWGIKVSGKVHYQGEEIGDHGIISVSNNKVKKTGKRR